MQPEPARKAPPFAAINSFLSLCRVCPAHPQDQVNSEYKRNFTWHDGYQATKVDVVRNAPSKPSCSEPSLPRKKKCPETQEGAEPPTDHAPESDAANRVPEEGERQQDSRKTEERQPLMSASYPPRCDPPPKTTEYRAQFVAWPRPCTPTHSSATARKSASMGLIAAQPAKQPPDAPSEAPTGELWNGVPDDDEESALDAVRRGRVKKTEYKAKFRPFSAYTYVDGSWKKATRLIKEGEDGVGSAWYSEVLERVRQADQYRARSHQGQQDVPVTLSPVAVGPSPRAWKEAKDRPRPTHHRKDKREPADIVEEPKSREGSTKKKHQLEKTTVRPKSAEPVLPVSKERSPKRIRPRAPRDLPLHGHGDLSGRKKGRGGAEKARQDERVWLKADQPLVNGFAPPEPAVHGPRDEHGGRQPPLRVPLTSVKSPEEVTGVRSPDPESWTVPIEVGKGLHWMDGRTPEAPKVLLSKRLKESSLASHTLSDTGPTSPGECVDL